jgi:murein DD-endopeptidase MepM/ murein hydrolase activator NlpD
MDVSKIVIGHPVDMSKVLLTQKFGETKYFDYSVYGYPGHNGIDLAPRDGLDGDAIMAAEGGVVVTAKLDTTGYGKVVRIDHGGYSTLYAHLNSYIVRVGDLVERFETIGYLGSTGNSTGPHLHFELRIPGQGAPGYGQGQVDPLPYFGALPETEAPAEPEDNLIAGDTCTVTGAGLRIRLRPEISDNIRGSLSAGDKLQLFGYQGDWVGVVMWVHKSYVSVSDDQ